MMSEADSYYVMFWAFLLLMLLWGAWKLWAQRRHKDE